MNQLKGSCLCGQITYSITDDFERFHLCHCTQCQKATGSAHASNLFAKADAFAWLSGEKLVKRFDVPGRAITQAFCTECGSGLPYRSKWSKGMMVVPAGTLDDQPSIAPKANIFWCERASWYEDGLSAEHVDQFQE